MVKLWFFKGRTCLRRFERFELLDCPGSFKRSSRLSSPFFLQCCSLIIWLLSILSQVRHLTSLSGNLCHLVWLLLPRHWHMALLLNLSKSWALLISQSWHWIYLFIFSLIWLTRLKRSEWFTFSKIERIHSLFWLNTWLNWRRSRFRALGQVHFFQLINQLSPI